MSIEERISRDWPWLVAGAIVVSALTGTLWAVAAIVVVPLLLRGWRVRHGHQLAVYRQITFAMAAEALLAAIVVASVGVAVFSLENPVLNWGWFSVVSAATGGGSGATNVVVVPLEIPWLAIPFLALLIWVLPDLAAVEERVFRLGTRGWREGLRRSITFAVAHLAMGIPIGALLPLTLAGLWLTSHYFKGGIERSTRYHLAYNSCLVAVATVAFVVLPALYPDL